MIAPVRFGDFPETRSQAVNILCETLWKSGDYAVRILCDSCGKLNLAFGCGNPFTPAQDTCRRNRRDPHPYHPLGGLRNHHTPTPSHPSLPADSRILPDYMAALRSRCHEAEIAQDPGAVPGLLRPAVVVNVAVRVGARTDFRFRPVALVDSAWPSGCVGRGRVLDRCLHECEHVLHTGSWRCYADHAGGSPHNGV